MESGKDATDSTDTTAYDYVHAKSQADFEAMSTKLSTLPTEIGLAGLEKHSRPIIDAELNPKTIEDSDRFETAYQALENFKDGQKCDLEMLINGPDGVLEMLNRCLAALLDAETEIATLRSTEGLKAVWPGKKSRKLTKDKGELEQEVERLRDVISVMQGQIEILRNPTGDAISEKDENPTTKHKDQAKQHEDTASPPGVAKGAPQNGMTEDEEYEHGSARLGELRGGKLMMESDEVDRYLVRVAKIGDWSMEQLDKLGLLDLKLENEAQKKLLNEVRHSAEGMMYFMVWLTAIMNGRQDRRNIDLPFDLASNAPEPGERWSREKGISVAILNLSDGYA